MEHKIILNKYKMIEKLGSGSFGDIYSGVNIRTREKVAIKIEPIINNTKLLKNETKIYQYLSGCLGIPQLKWFGVDNENNYMVINLLGTSLSELVKKYKRFSLNLTLQIGIQILERLKTIHEKGLIHRDVKPDNFLMGDNNILFIIDFGLCKTYWDENRNHIKKRKLSNLLGTPDFISINVHNLVEPTRRDDLESLGYIFLYLYNGELEWQKINNINDNHKNNKNELIKNAKREFVDSLKNQPFVSYFKYVQNLEFNETPNYEHLIELLTRNM